MNSSVGISAKRQMSSSPSSISASGAIIRPPPSRRELQTASISMAAARARSRPRLRRRGGARRRLVPISTCAPPIRYANLPARVFSCVDGVGDLRDEAAGRDIHEVVVVETPEVDLSRLGPARASIAVRGRPGSRARWRSRCRSQAAPARRSRQRARPPAATPLSASFSVPSPPATKRGRSRRARPPPPARVALGGRHDEIDVAEPLAQAIAQPACQLGAPIAPRRRIDDQP